MSSAGFAAKRCLGRTVTEHVFEARPSLVYFGYANCPEVCPTTLIKMADWLNELGPEGRELQALFFTIDPERDTPDVLGPYVASISDRIVGVTGSKAEMHKASQAGLSPAAAIAMATLGATPRSARNSWCGLNKRKVFR